MSNSVYTDRETLQMEPFVKSETYRRDLLTAIRKKIPGSPGVYLFSDQNDDLMYVGKSVNLRQRISSYFPADVTRCEYRIREMIQLIADIEYYETGTELLALLLEDSFIKTRHPRYNVRQQQYMGYQYILLTEDVYPTCKMISHADDPGPGQLFGPFKSKFFVRDLLWIIRRFLKLRSCEEPEPVRFSLGFEFGYCTGPCRHKISTETYADIVNRVVDFLQGDGDHVIYIITEAMEKASALLRFEKAEELKERLDFCERFCERQRFLHRFKNERLTLHENGIVNAIYRFEKGQLTSLRGAPSEARECKSLLRQELIHEENDPRFLLDRGNIVYSWIRNEKNGCEWDFGEGEGE